ncbi:Uncharacterized protein FWK35_00030436, partial [Aphis craccivora]
LKQKAGMLNLNPMIAKFMKISYKHNKFYFYVSVYSIICQNNAPISNFGGGFRCKSEYPWCIIEEKSKNFPTAFKKMRKKNDGKTGFFSQNQFSTKSIFLYGYNSKTNHCKYLKCSPNVYVHVNKKKLDNQKHMKIEHKFKFLRNMSKTRKFAKLEIQYEIFHKFSLHMNTVQLSKDLQNRVNTNP